MAFGLRALISWLPMVCLNSAKPCQGFIGGNLSARRGDVEDLIRAEGVAVSPLVRRSKQCRLALERLDAKQDIIRQMIDGRLHLIEAAECFRELTRSTAGNSGTSQSDEDVCRGLIGWVYLALCERPERAESLSAQLEAELAAHLQRRGQANLS